MLKRIMMLPISLAAAAGVPFLALNDDLKTQLTDAIGAFSGGEQEATAEVAAEDGLLSEIPSPFSRGISVSGVNWDELQENNPFSLASDTRNSNSNSNTQRTNNTPSSSGNNSTSRPSTNSAPPLNSSQGYGSVPSATGSASAQSQFVSGSNQTPPQLPNDWPSVPTLGSDLRQVIRFDVTPNWIKAHWPRVSVGWTEDGLEGFRVPLVTGTQVHDLTGALTYYFDSKHRVQRIRFVGNTGDASPLVDLCQRYYEMEIEPTRIAGYYSRRYHGRPVNVLRVTHEAVLRADAPNTQLNIVLELNNPAGDYNLSQATIDLLNTDPPLID